MRWQMPWPRTPQLKAPWYLVSSCPPSMYLGQMAAGLGPRTGQQVARCKASDTPMEVVLLLCPLWWGCGHSSEGWPYPSHTHVRHPTPVCAPCRVELCVRHILSDYPRYTVRHQRFYLSSSINGMLGVDPDILTWVFAFLHAIDILQLVWHLHELYIILWWCVN